MIKEGKNQSEIYIGDTIEYDVKSYQVKVTIVKLTNIQVKVITVLTVHRKTFGTTNNYVTQLNKIKYI